MTNQDIFDKVLAHLRQQKFASVAHIDKRLTCAYRGPFNTSCAVGCLLTEYDAVIEGKGVEALLIFPPADFGEDLKTLLKCLRNSGITTDHLKLLKALQNAHDGYMPRPVGMKDQSAMACASLESWEREMRSVAENFDLTYTAPQATADATA